MLLQTSNTKDLNTTKAKAVLYMPTRFRVGFFIKSTIHYSHYSVFVKFIGKKPFVNFLIIFLIFVDNL